MSDELVYPIRFNILAGAHSVVQFIRNPSAGDGFYTALCALHLCATISVQQSRITNYRIALKQTASK